MGRTRDILFRIPEHSELAPVMEAGREDLDQAQLAVYMERVREKYGAVFMEAPTLLEKLGILSPAAGGGHPTVAGLVLFGENPQLFLPQLHVTLLQGEGPDPQVVKFTGTLQALKDQAMEAIRNRSGKRTVVGYLSGKPAESPAFPLEGVEEAVVNALVHRDYAPFALGRYVRIHMTAKSIEIRSPGTLVGERAGEVSLEDHYHVKNGILVRIMEELGQVRNAGLGIRRMLGETRSLRLEPPSFELEGEDFVVRFGNREILSAEEIRRFSEMDLRLDESQMAALAFVHKHGSISNREYQHLNGVNRDGAFRELKRLVEEGLLSPEGTGSGTCYVLNDDFSKKRTGRQLDFLGSMGS